MSVSVVMAVHNGERFVAESIESVLNQTLEDLELIVVDDGSTDQSPEILESYARRDRRVKVIHQHHGGVPAAANLGIRHASHHLIARTDSDDRMLPNRLLHQVAFLKEHPEVAVACSNCYFINAGGKRIGSSNCRVDLARGKRELNPSLFLELTQSTILMRKEAFHRIGGYREDLYFAEDRDLWGRFATAGFSIACQNEFLVDFRLHSGSMTMKRAAFQHEICNYIDENIIRRLQGKPELSLTAFRAARQREPLVHRLRENVRFAALHAFKRASRYYGEGQYCKCALSLAAAVSLNPGHIVGRVIHRMQIHEANA
jgi:glycosyltransferase involved in cell wall biosynthesis